MPAKRRTAAELLLSGAAKAKPGRYASRLNPPHVEPLGAAPSHLSKSQKIIWRQIVKHSPPGLLAASDCFLLEVAVYLLERVRTAAVVKPSEIAVLVSILSKLGLSPADRARLDLPAPSQPKADDPWESF